MTPTGIDFSSVSGDYFSTSIDLTPFGFDAASAFEGGIRYYHTTGCYYPFDPITFTSGSLNISVNTTGLPVGYNIYNIKLVSGSLLQTVAAGYFIIQPNVWTT